MGNCWFACMGKKPRSCKKKKKNPKPTCFYSKPSIKFCLKLQNSFQFWHFMCLRAPPGITYCRLSGCSGKRFSCLLYYTTLAPFPLPARIYCTHILLNLCLNSKLRRCYMHHYFVPFNRCFVGRIVTSQYQRKEGKNPFKLRSSINLEIITE